MKKIAVITGAGGGMGVEITRAIASVDYQVIMACMNLEKASIKKQKIIQETGNNSIEVVKLDLSSLQSVKDCATHILNTYGSVDLLMNNAGVIATRFEETQDGFEKMVGTNYVGHYLFSRILAAEMKSGARIVNMVSCTCNIGQLRFPNFFVQGKNGLFWRIPFYSNTKLALLLFTCELSEHLKDKGISVNAADPGVVSTDMITMKKWFDPLTDLFFRPFIRTPLKGASGAINLLLKEECKQYNNCISINNRVRSIASKYLNHPKRKELWSETEKMVNKFL